MGFLIDLILSRLVLQLEKTCVLRHESQNSCQGSAQQEILTHNTTNESMQLENLTTGKFIKRYKRFMVDVCLDNGEIITAHCPNSGRMTGCYSEGCKVMLSYHDNPKRKFKYTLELTSNEQTWIVSNTNRANELAYDAIVNGSIPELAGYQNYRREVKYGKSSRIDILGESENENCWIEVKSVTMLTDSGHYCFPDAPTARGQKHLCELMEMKRQGDRAVMLFIVMREDGDGTFTPADFVDPKYAVLLKEAIDAGVEVLVYKSKITYNSIEIDKNLLMVN